MKNYSLRSCEKLINSYINEYNGSLTQVSEGVLGLGFLILHDAPKKKTVLIKEYFINSWCSGHSVKFYNKIPKKYQQIINKIH